MATEITALPKLYIGIGIHKQSRSIHIRSDISDHKNFTDPAERLVIYDYVELIFYITKSIWPMRLAVVVSVQAYYRTHIGKNPKSIVVKIAKKLLNLILSIIKTEKSYQINYQKEEIMN